VGLARAFDFAIAVESNPAAARDLRANLANAGCEAVEVIEARVEDALAGPRLASRRPDVVVLDPPRTGLPPDAADAIADLAPRRIVYLACDPATQARDARNFRGRGYELASLAAFDLFPQTPHVETLAVFDASGQGSTSPWRTA
jgi:tRNA/tmRNA/rRNA uracil-C5-methylase (TrmA/RlmC/RlmD family)